MNPPRLRIRSLLLALSRGLFGIIGVAGLVIPAGQFLSAIASECIISFGWMEFRSTEGGACVQHLGTPQLVVTSVLGFFLLAAALWVTADDRAERVLAAIGIAACFLVSVAPIWWAIQVVNYFGPYEGDLMTYAIGMLLTIVGASSALVLSVAWGQAQSDR